ncbi:MAG TPA: hypothetical protein PLV59_03220 [Candidatus Dojkabacteria bacterium]|nr:hypothetical protein [Candidatus Dojkabacteria bacterium]
MSQGFETYEDRLVLMTKEHEDQLPPKEQMIIHGVTDDIETLRSKAYEIIESKGKCRNILVKPSCTNDPTSNDFLITLTFDFPDHYEKVSYLTARPYMALSFGIFNKLGQELLAN